MGKHITQQKRGEELKLSLESKNYFQTTAQASYGEKEQDTPKLALEASQKVKKNESQVIFGEDKMDFYKKNENDGQVPNSARSLECKQNRQRFEKGSIQMGGGNFVDDSPTIKKSNAPYKKEDNFPTSPQHKKRAEEVQDALRSQTSSPRVPGENFNIITGDDGATPNSMAKRGFFSKSANRVQNGTYNIITNADN